MALSDESGSVPTTMLVSPTGGMNNGMWGDGAWWIILLFIVLFANGGWGNNGMNNGAPIIVNDNASNGVQRGFDQASIMGGINGVQSGINGLSTQLCNGFAGVTASVNGGVNAIQAQMYGNQIADLERSFAAQTANTQGLTALQAQLAQCCCDNRLATANLGATIASENCADREALNYATRDIINSQTSGIQRILDQLCQDKIDAKNDTIAQLRSELMYARGQASQDVQTAAIQAGQRALANEVEQYVLPTPRPAYIVANPSCCYQQTCGCNG